jgi:hypothetical protein
MAPWPDGGLRPGPANEPARASHLNENACHKFPNRIRLRRRIDQMNTALGPARYCLLPLPASHARERMRWLFAKSRKGSAFPALLRNRRRRRGLVRYLKNGYGFRKTHGRPCSRRGMSDYEFTYKYGSLAHPPLLEELAQFYSRHYGRWSPNSEYRPGHQIKLTADMLRGWLKKDSRISLQNSTTRWSGMRFLFRQTTARAASSPG